jgi:hypothetical protein
VVPKIFGPQFPWAHQPPRALPYKKHSSE